MARSVVRWRLRPGLSVRACATESRFRVVATTVDPRRMVISARPANGASRTLSLVVFWRVKVMRTGPPGRVVSRLSQTVADRAARPGRLRALRRGRRQRRRGRHASLWATEAGLATPWRGSREERTGYRRADSPRRTRSQCRAIHPASELSSRRLHTPGSRTTAGSGRRRGPTSP